MMAPTWAVANFASWTTTTKQAPAALFEQQLEPEYDLAAVLDVAVVPERANSVNTSALQRTESVDKAVFCIVPGCGKDLHSAKQYYQQHRICEEHFKCSSFELGGVLSRFCQQCARPHALSEFDGLLRSCKEQLRKHRMRRKSRKSDTTEDTEPAKKVSCASARDGDPALMFRLGIDGRRCSSGEIPNSHANLAGDFYEDWPYTHSPQQFQPDGQSPLAPNEWSHLHSSLSGGSSGSFVHLSPRWTQQQQQQQQQQLSQQHQQQQGYDPCLTAVRPQQGSARQETVGGTSRLNSEHRTFVTPFGRVHRNHSSSPLFASNSSNSMMHQQQPLHGNLSGGHSTPRNQDEVAICHDRWSVPEYLMHSNSGTMQAAPIYEEKRVAPLVERRQQAQQLQRSQQLSQQQQQPQHWQRQVQSHQYPLDSELQSSPFSYDMYMAAMQDGGDSREVTTSVVTTGIVTTAQPYSTGAAGVQHRVVGHPQMSVNTQQTSQRWSPQQLSPQEASRHGELGVDDHVPQGLYRQGSNQGLQLQQQQQQYESQRQAFDQQPQPASNRKRVSQDHLNRYPPMIQESMDSHSYNLQQQQLPSQQQQQQQQLLSQQLQQQQQQQSLLQQWQDEEFLGLLPQPSDHHQTQTISTEPCPMDGSTDKDLDLAHAVLQWLPLTANTTQQPQQLLTSAFTFDASLCTPNGSGDLAGLLQSSSSTHWKPPTVETGNRDKGHIFYRQQLQSYNSGERAALRLGHSTSRNEKSSPDAETTPSPPTPQGMLPEQQHLQQQQQEMWPNPLHGQQASDCSHSTGTGVQPISQNAPVRDGIAVGSYHAMNSSINSRPGMVHSGFDTTNGGFPRGCENPPSSGVWRCPTPNKSS